jgi:hypothetical protein
VPDLTPEQAKRHLWTLRSQLRRITEADPEQEVRGIALPVVDEVIAGARDALGDNPIAARIDDIISVEAIREGEPIRAVDMLILVEQLYEPLKRV